MDIIEIAKECCSYPVKASDSHWCGEGEFIFNESGLNAFAQRIEAPHLQRIAELEKDCDILATNYDAARRASRFAADVADQAYANLNAKDKQIEQLREALTRSSYSMNVNPSFFIRLDTEQATFHHGRYLEVYLMENTEGTPLCHLSGVDDFELSYTGPLAQEKFNALLELGSDVSIPQLLELGFSQYG